MTTQTYPAGHVQARNELIDGAIAAGKFPESRRKNYEALFDTNPDYAKQLIAKLAAGVPAQAAMERSDSYDTSWLSPVERSRITAAQAGTPSNITKAND